MADKGKARRVAKDRQGYPIDLERPIVVDDEGVHTELSATEQMGDKWVNFPTVWKGRRYRMDDDAERAEVMKNVEESRGKGWRFPEFDSIEAAEAAAKDRSQYIGKLRSKEIRDAEKRMWAEEAAKRNKRD